MSSRKYDRMSLGELKEAATALSKALRKVDPSPQVQEPLHAELNEVLDEIRRRERGE